MAGVPTFSSFPERPKPASKPDSTWEQGGLQASTSANNSAAPTFSSFPERTISKSYDDGTEKRREEDRYRRSRESSPETPSDRKRHKSDRRADDQERKSNKGHREHTERDEKRSEKRERHRSHKAEHDDEERSRKHSRGRVEPDIKKENKKIRPQEPVGKVSTFHSISTVCASLQLHRIAAEHRHGQRALLR
jgi:hypothetical protein